MYWFWCGIKGTDGWCGINRGLDESQEGICARKGRWCGSNKGWGGSKGGRGWRNVGWGRSEGDKGLGNFLLSILSYCTRY